jgi:tRNA(His) guanylyltransferase
MNDSLGNRMKANYENRTRFFVPRRTYTVIRVDGRAFHTFTRGCERPFDARLIAAMDATALFLCREISGAKCAYVQLGKSRPRQNSKPTAITSTTCFRA